jgi:glycosyltransferase involved in cell wall biosynthesis
MSASQQRGLRIAHVQPMTLDLYGHDDAGYGTSVRYSVSNLAAAQARLGHHPEVHLLTSGRPRELRVAGVTAHFHRCVQPPRRASLHARFARQFSVAMLRAIRRESADVVHFHGVRQLHLMYAAVASRAAQQGIPLVGQDRGNRDVGRIETAAQRFGLRRTKDVLAASAESVDVLAGLGVPRTAIHVVPNAVDPDVFRPGAARERAAGDPFRILVVSRLWPDKDPLTMADGVCELVRRGQPVSLTVISRGPLRDEVEARLRAGGVPVEFIEHVPQQQLVEYYRSADALVLTSLREGWNQVILEAMASGLPVVLTAVPGPRDAAGNAGFLVPVRSPDAVANALERLASDRALWLRHRALGLERARAFTWDAVARQLDDIYREVLRDAPARAHVGQLAESFGGVR